MSETPSRENSTVCAMSDHPHEQDAASVAEPRSSVGRLAQARPVATFLALTFGWTWLFWCAAIPFRSQPLLVTALVLVGGFGPALAAVETLRLRSGRGVDLSAKRVGAMLASAAVVFGAVWLRFFVGNAPGVRELAPDLTLSTPIALTAGFACLVGGWVISAAVSDNRQVRDRFASLLPRRLPLGSTVLALVFYSAMLLAAWALATLLNAPVEYPALWGEPPLEVLPLYALVFAVTLLVQGGNEEPGWRGFLQPELQTRFSPLAAAVLVSFVWSLWHLPLFLNGFYGEGGLVAGMAGGGVYRVFLSIFLAWFYTRSGGNLFLTCWMHASFNLMPTFLPTFETGLVVLWMLGVAGLVFKDEMWRKRPALQPDPKQAAEKAACPGQDGPAESPRL
jgi:membrane protease YdiL (CAAX protease family)